MAAIGVEKSSQFFRRISNSILLFEREDTYEILDDEAYLISMAASLLAAASPNLSMRASYLPEYLELAVSTTKGL